jgi:hypothetical protein
MGANLSVGVRHPEIKKAGEPQKILGSRPGRPTFEDFLLPLESRPSTNNG